MIGDDIAAALPELRAQAESVMRDTGQAFNPGGTATNPRTGVEEKAFVATSDSGPCKVQGPGGGRGSDTTQDTVNIGGVDRVVSVGGLHRPIGAPLLEVGYEWRITATGPTSDPALLGRRYRIVGVPVKSNASARRYDVVEVTWERNTP